MRILVYLVVGILGCVGIAIGHIFACLPLTLHKAYVLGELADWFNLWVYLTLFLGLPGLVLVKAPTALCLYLIIFNTKPHRILQRLNQSYFVLMLLALAIGAIGAICSSSIIKGAIDSLSAAIYFVAIIETARFCSKLCELCKADLTNL